ncbi:MAG: hypothetical protein ACI89R_001322 [Candidatus Azotimanducaceae bacterium]|jgi:hypothetical protein
MKKVFLIIGLVLITVISSGFSESTKSKKVYSENCFRALEIVTVPSITEIRNNITAPFTGKSYVGFKEAVGFKESRNRYHIINTFGYLGKYQFGKSTLRRLKVYNAEKFLKNPEQQERAFKALCSLNKYILRKDIRRSVGNKINGVVITESGILAAAHLGGAGNVKKFLRSNGDTNFSDAYGTSIKYYMKKFSGFDVSSIEADRNPLI